MMNLMMLFHRFIIELCGKGTSSVKRNSTPPRFTLQTRAK